MNSRTKAFIMGVAVGVAVHYAYANRVSGVVQNRNH